MRRSKLKKAHPFGTVRLKSLPVTHEYGIAAAFAFILLLQSIAFLPPEPGELPIALKLYLGAWTIGRMGIGFLVIMGLAKLVRVCQNLKSKLHQNYAIGALVVSCWILLILYLNTGSPWILLVSCLVSGGLGGYWVLQDFLKPR